MKMRVFGFRDVKAGEYSAPIFCVNVAMFTRQLVDLLRQRGDMPVQKYPEDFQVYEFGVFDTEAGTWEMNSTPTFLFDVSQFVVKSN